MGKPRSFHAAPVNAMSCGFTNDATASHGRVVVGGGELAEQVDDLLANTPSRDEAGVGLVDAVRLTTDPPGEPERVEPVGAAVGVDRGGSSTPSASLTFRLSWVPGMTRSGWETCHLPR